MALRDLYARKWSRRSKAFAVVALACGLLTFRIVDGYAGELETLRPLAGSLVPVVVATGDLSRGEAIAEGDVRLERIPDAYAPPGSVHVTDDAVGQTLVSDVAAGEAITATRISVAGGPVASLVPSGLRAFPIAATVPAGSIRPGDRVDVIATYGGPHPYTDTVATGLEVLSTTDAQDGALVATADGTTSLLLLVTSETAEQLAYASAYADLAVSIASAKGDGV
jgi:Flp pilus assembly protein CpaB